MLKKYPDRSKKIILQSCCLLQPLPKGREPLLAVFEAVGVYSFPLGMVRMGLSLPFVTPIGAFSVLTKIKLMAV